MDDREKRIKILLEKRNEIRRTSNIVLASSEWYGNEIEILAMLTQDALEDYAETFFPHAQDVVRLMTGENKRTLVVTLLLAQQSVIMGKVEIITPGGEPLQAMEGGDAEPGEPSWQKVMMAVMTAQPFSIEGAATAIKMRLGRKYSSFADMDTNRIRLEALIDNPPDGWKANKEDGKVQLVKG